MSFFTRLRDDNADIWSRYVGHPFVQGLQDGTLPKPAFEYYLKQDYLFLIQFAKAYALAAYKSDTLDQMKAATATVSALIDTEMALHIEYCAQWGISEKEMQEIAEDPQNMAYTRYVLEKGHSGDILDLYVALSPCVIGYGEIGKLLGQSARTKREGNPYLPWIEMYAGDDYQAVFRSAIEQLDGLAEERLTPARYASLSKTFAEATRLEVGFWQMGLDVLKS
ncbi:thiaminase II [Sneathiella aquimaris]|uniref:thiaminase II n=1 Tax=Sneathiella aquimaris TaxID=2599305 RepID=UPI00146A34B4|nr:thiaminase II [Sneathiella aquimaris]